LHLTCDVIITHTCRALDGLKKTKDIFINNIGGAFTRNKIDEASLKELEVALYKSDVGHTTTQLLVDRIKTNHEQFRQNILATTPNTEYSLQKHLRHEMLEILNHKNQKNIDYNLKSNQNPTVLFMVGVNGAGKTTTVGKIMSMYKNTYGRNLIVAAADTHRAAAVEQLQEWGKRSEIPVITGQTTEQLATQQQSNKKPKISFKQVAGKISPESVVYHAIQHAIQQTPKANLVIVDTAGRLQNNVLSMEELQRTLDIAGKARRGAPDYVWLVVDATIGQNSIDQAKVFQKKLRINGLVVTKLDSSAKGGVVLGIANELKIPVMFIGVGERVDDIRKFDPEEFVDSIIGSSE
jgi:fused signal recognition particle receptor